jgi:glycosyltransferase involved in cell wall biosynthesis
MHILLIHQAFAALDEAGGTRHAELASYLAGCGHHLTIISSPVSYLTGETRRGRQRWVEEDAPQPGVRILRAYTYSALHRSFFHRLLAFFSFMISSFIIGLRVGPVDLVWGTSPPIFQGVTAWLIARLRGATFLFEVRDLWPAFAVAVGVLKNRTLIRLSEGLERFLYQRADCLVVNSPGYIAHVRERGARRVELIPNGSDPAMFTPLDRGEAFRQRNALEGKFAVLYAGAHGLSNDLGVVIEAARSLAGRHDIQIVLLGDGKEKKALVAQAQGLTNVTFLPPVAKTGMAEALAAADACLAILKPIQLYQTTYPNKVFDYMAAGRPLLLAIDGVIRKVVEEAGAGLFVPPGNPQALAQAILDLAGDPARAVQMGRNGRLAVEQHYDRRVTAEQMRILLEGLRRGNG